MKKGIGIMDSHAASEIAQNGCNPEEPVDELLYSNFEVGDIVNHRTFGEGVIIKIEDDKFFIYFEKENKTRKLLENYAPIVKTGKTNSAIQTLNALTSEPVEDTERNGTSTNSPNNSNKATAESPLNTSSVESDEEFYFGKEDGRWKQKFLIGFILVTFLGYLTFKYHDAHVLPDEQIGSMAVIGLAGIWLGALIASAILGWVVKAANNKLQKKKIRDSNGVAFRIAPFVFLALCLYTNVISISLNANSFSESDTEILASSNANEDDDYDAFAEQRAARKAAGYTKEDIEKMARDFALGSDDNFVFLDWDGDGYVSPDDSFLQKSDFFGDDWEMTWEYERYLSGRDYLHVNRSSGRSYILGKDECAEMSRKSITSLEKLWEVGYTVELEKDKGEITGYKVESMF